MQIMILRRLHAGYDINREIVIFNVVNQSKSEATFLFADKRREAIFVNSPGHFASQSTSVTQFYHFRLDKRSDQRFEKQTWLSPFYPISSEYTKNLTENNTWII